MSCLLKDLIGWTVSCRMLREPRWISEGPQSGELPPRGDVFWSLSIGRYPLSTEMAILRDPPVFLSKRCPSRGLGSLRG